MQVGTGKTLTSIMARDMAQPISGLANPRLEHHRISRPVRACHHLVCQSWLECSSSICYIFVAWLRLRETHTVSVLLSIIHLSLIAHISCALANMAFQSPAMV